MLDFTVVIPTYNGVNRLPFVLNKLQLQIETELIKWEILIIDNNSADTTAQLIAVYQENGMSPVPLRYCFESQQGLAFARQRGVKEAQGELIGFLDDDNLPHPTWLIASYKFAQKYPKAGAYNGRIIGEFEISPPENFEKMAQFLALRDHGLQPRLFEPENLRLPPGAGLVVRKIAWEKSVPSHTTLKGRIGKSLMGGSEDYEVQLYLYKQGWDIWYNPEMCISHYIPSQRLQRNYLLSLAKGCGLSTYHLRMILAKNWEKPLIFIRTLLGNARRILIHLIKYNLKLKQNLAATFELEFLLVAF